jgi:hypothetical protein
MPALEPERVPCDTLVVWRAGLKLFNEKRREAGNVVSNLNEMIRW